MNQMKGGEEESIFPKLIFQERNLNQKKGAVMKPVLRYRSQLLFRKSYKPTCVIRIRPTTKVNFVFRPANRFGAKPQLVTVP